MFVKLLRYYWDAGLLLSQIPLLLFICTQMLYSALISGLPTSLITTCLSPSHPLVGEFILAIISCVKISSSHPDVGLVWVSTVVMFTPLMMFAA